MQLKTFLEFYSSQFNEIKVNNKGKKKLVDTIPSTINNLDDILSTPSHASKSGLNSSNPKNKNTYDESTYSRPDTKSNLNTKRLLNEDLPNNIKECPSDNHLPNRKRFEFADNKLSTERIPKFKSPAESIENNEKQNLSYSPISQLKEVNRDNNYTELTQKHTTYIKEIIKDAGIDTSDEGINEKQGCNIEVVPRENNEKPTFFETSVDIPPYLQPKAQRKINEIPNFNNQFGTENDLNPRFDLDYTDNEGYNKQIIKNKEGVFDGNKTTLINTNSTVLYNSSIPKIIGRKNYSNCKDFMNEHFNHRELIAMKDLNRVDRIKYSRKFYRSKISSS